MGLRFPVIALGQVGLAFAAFVLMGPCLLVILRTGRLHVNSKFLLVLSLMCQLIIISIQPYVIGRELFCDIPEPDVMENDSTPSLIVHNFAYALSSVCLCWLACDQVYAITHLEEYSQRTVPSELAKFTLTLLAFPMCIGFSLYVHLARDYYLAVFIMTAIETSTVLLSLYSVCASRRRFRESIEELPLNERYHIVDIVEYSRAVLPICIFSSLLKTVALVPMVFYFNYHLDYVYARAVFFSMHTINCVIMKGLLILLHRGLRKSSKKYFPCSSLSDNRIRPQPRALSEREIYFSMLKEAWDA